MSLSHLITIASTLGIKFYRQASKEKLFRLRHVDKQGSLKKRRYRFVGSRVHPYLGSIVLEVSKLLPYTVLEQRRFDVCFDVLADILEHCLDVAGPQGGTESAGRGWLAPQLEALRLRSHSPENTDVPTIHLKHAYSAECSGFIVAISSRLEHGSALETCPVQEVICTGTPFSYAFLTWGIPERLVVSPPFLDQSLMRRLGAPVRATYLAEVPVVSLNSDWVALIYLALRGFITGAAPLEQGWAAGLADMQIAEALAHLHQLPGANWTVGDLASHVGADRSRFARRFTAVVGCSPMQYVVKWRMILAERQLLQTDNSLAVIAASLGFQRQSSFGAVFKRHFGAQPSVYRRQHRSKGGAA